MMRDSETTQSSIRRRVRLPKLRAKPGARPGTIVVDPAAPKPRIRVMAYDREHVAETDVTDIESLREQVGKHAVTWINVDGLGDANTLRQLGDVFGIHSLSLEDIAHVHQRAKVEQYDDHLFIVARMVHADGGAATEQVSLLVGSNFVLSFQERAGVTSRSVSSVPGTSAVSRNLSSHS